MSQSSNRRTGSAQFTPVTPDVEQYLHMFQQMLKIRYFEEEVNELYKTAKMPGLAHLYIGQEAVAVGVCEALGARCTAPTQTPGTWGQLRS
jgi:TPP-dependent pyruvate/acetoin dehydrogenase alpha subunit